LPIANAGMRREGDSSPAGTAENSTQNLFRVVVDIVLLEKDYEFFFKTALPIMFLLGIDVTNGLGLFGDAHAENCVTLLPSNLGLMFSLSHFEEPPFNS
jgi:hypothetical protein